MTSGHGFRARTFGAPRNDCRNVCAVRALGRGCRMASLDAVSITILLGAVLVLAGILSSLIALRFGAPLLLLFLIIGMAAGESGPGGIRFDDVRAAYMVGSIALALILFDGGLRTRLQTFRSVLAPAGLLATLGVLVTAALTASLARLGLGIGWTESLLVGAMVGSTDAAAVFLLIHAGGLRLRPRVAATLEVESATNDPFAVFLAIVLVEILLVGDQPWSAIALTLAEQGLLGAAVGILGGRAMALVLNRLDLPQGLHAPFVATAALVTFGVAAAVHGSGFLAAYLAGLIVGNRPTRAHRTIVVFLDAITWLAQIVMFVLLGLLVGMKEAQLYFDVVFVVVLVSLLVQGWTLAAAARRLGVAFARPDPVAHRVELDLPGQMAQELVGYAVEADSPYLRRGITPAWAKPTLVVRDEHVLTAAEAGPVRPGDYVYLLAPPGKAAALDRFFVDMPPPSSPDPRLLGDFFVSADATLGALAEIYGLALDPAQAGTSLADHFARELGRPTRQGDVLRLGDVLLIAHKVVAGRLTQVGLQLAEPDTPAKRPAKPVGRLRSALRRGLAFVIGRS